ncbi:hypothetical protein AKJ16_DCAP02958 [Drosera capensis]
MSSVASSRILLVEFSRYRLAEINPLVAGSPLIGFDLRRTSSSGVSEAVPRTSPRLSQLEALVSVIRKRGRTDLITKDGRALLAVELASIGFDFLKRSRRRVISSCGGWFLIIELVEFRVSADFRRRQELITSEKEVNMVVDKGEPVSFIVLSRDGMKHITS